MHGWIQMQTSSMRCTRFSLIEKGHITHSSPQEDLVERVGIVHVLQRELNKSVSRLLKHKQLNRRWRSMSPCAN